MLNLWGTGHGIGVQNNTTYFRTSDNFAWYKGGSHNHGPLNAGTNGTSLMTLNTSGNLVIGTTDLIKGKLHIEGSVNYQSQSYRYFVNRSDSNNIAKNSTGSYSLYASDRIGCVEFNAFSDLRIKEIKGNSDSQADLQTLLQIQVTDYHYKDKIANGNRPKKKVIGQQVADVYPQAVSTHVDVVPDIFESAIIEENWVTLNSHNLKIGDKVKIFWNDNDSQLFTVEDIKTDKFKIPLNHTGDIFVYGREVDDFHVVDYDALSMLHISATQELYKIIKKLEQKLNEKIKD
ncbi:phage tail Collar [Microcystis aeruginosa NIES-3806]|uniref:Phage tail Collar n=2 Tax=Microcystis aeruginosa TaxID=1126 RepID=A0AAD3B309_MICAE|nr:phage tail Collar [Microcystis aeruginosa NIES-3806]GCL60439.1 phage tail Collar [Microcystis aeruginosa NIES-3807]